MRRTERKLRVHEYDVVVELRCDLCNARSPSDHDWTEVTDTYGVANVTIEQRIGAQYPEGGTLYITSFDVCPECFRAKVVPWLASQGATPRETREYV